MTKPIKPHHRSAMTLIELVGVMAIGALILALTTSVLMNMMRVESNTRFQVVQIDSISRLADQFRQDIHDAIDVRLSDQASERLLIDKGSSGQVVYTRQGRSILRTEQRGGETGRREGFRLPADVQVIWQRIERPRQTFVRLHFSPQKRYSMVVVAELGRNQVGVESEGEAEP